MKRAIAIYRRELAAAFRTPALYVVAGLFFFLISNIVVQSLVDYSRRSTNTDAVDRVEVVDFTQAVVAGPFGAVSILFVFVIPILTMRAFAEEKRSGTFEMLATWPLRDWELILGKFLSLTTVVLTIDALMLVYVGVFYWLASPEPGVTVSCVLGLVLISLAYTAFGVFVSSLTENQIVAAIGAFAGLFFFWIVQNLGGEGTSLFSQTCDALSIYLHFANIVKGNVTLQDVAFFLLFTGFWLFLTARALESRRWRV